MTGPDLDALMRSVVHSIRLDERRRAAERVKNLAEFTVANFNRWPDLQELACAVLDYEDDKLSVTRKFWAEDD